MLHEKGYRASIINARFIKPIDEEAAVPCADHDMIVTMEENVKAEASEKRLLLPEYYMTGIKCVMAAGCLYGTWKCRSFEKRDRIGCRKHHRENIWKSYQVK